MTKRVHDFDALQRYRDFQPTGVDAKGLGLPDQQDWLVCPCSITRDSGVLSQANWESQLQLLRHEGIDFEVHRFGHWGPGWFEIVITEPTMTAAACIEGIQSCLANYPILDEERHSDMEDEARQEYWETMSMRCRIELCHREGVSIFAARRDYPDERLDERLNIWANEG